MTRRSQTSSTRRFWLVALALALVTAAELGTTRLGLAQPVTLALLLVFAALKATLIVAVFMELSGDAGILRLLFLVPLSLAVSMVLVFLSLFHWRVGIAG